MALRRLYGHLTEEDLIRRLLAEDAQFSAGGGLSENTAAVLRRLGYDPAVVRRGGPGGVADVWMTISGRGQPSGPPADPQSLLLGSPTPPENPAEAAFLEAMRQRRESRDQAMASMGAAVGTALGQQFAGVPAAAPRTQPSSDFQLGGIPGGTLPVPVGSEGDWRTSPWGRALLGLLYGITQIRSNQTAAGAAQMFNQWLTQQREQQATQALGGTLGKVQAALGSGDYEQAQSLLGAAMQTAKDRTTLKQLSDLSGQVLTLQQNARMRQAIAPLLNDNPLAAAIMSQPGATIKDVMPLLLDRYTFKTDPGTNAVLAIDKQSGAVTPLTQGMVRMRPDESLVRMGPEGPQVAFQAPGRRTVANLGSAFNLYALEKFKTTDLSSVPQDQLAQAAAEFRQMQERKEGPNLTGLMGVLAAKHGFPTKLSELKPEDAARIEQQWVNVQKFLAEARGRAMGAAELEKMMTAPLNFVNRDLVVLDTKTFSPDFKASFTDATEKPGKTIVREMDLRIINRINSMLNIVGDLKQVASRELALRPGENAYRALRIAIGRRLGDPGVAEFDALRSNLLGIAGLIQGDNRVSNLDYESVRGFNPQDFDTAESAMARLETLERSLSRMRAALSNLPVESRGVPSASQGPQQPTRKRRVNVPGVGEVEVEVE